MTDCPTHDRAAVWSRYWSLGPLHSCVTSYTDNYGGAIGQFWRGVFALLKPGEHVLDIGTGNGALPHLLLQCRPDADVTCHAVDVAAIDPAWIQKLPASQRRSLRFHSRVEAEQLPFDDCVFDLVVSQYGLEYSDLQRSVPELRRVLAPGGRIAMILHHADSRPVNLAREETAHIDWLLSTDGLVEMTERLLSPMALAASEAGRRALARDERAIADRASFNQLQDVLSARLTGAVCPDVLHETRTELAQILFTSSHQGEQAAASRLALLRHNLSHQRVRLVQLCEAALDEPRVRAVAAALRGEEAAQISPVLEGSWIMGWTLRAGRESRAPTDTY